MGKHILVTGGCGFIGSFLVDELVRLGWRVRIFDSLDPQVHPTGQAPAWLNKEAEFIRGDVRDYSALERALRGIEIVSHHASAVGVGQSQYQVKHYTDVNIGGTANLLDLIVNKYRGIEKLTVASSMSCYGEGAYRCAKCNTTDARLREAEDMNAGRWELRCPHCRNDLMPVGTTEEKPFAPNSIYAITKRVQEDMVMHLGITYKIPTVALRYFNVYGLRQSLSNPYTGVVAIFLSRLLNDNRPVVYEDGGQRRDFVSVHDIVGANVLAIENDKANHKSFNVGTGEPVSVGEIALALAGLLKKNIAPKVVGKFRPGDIRHCYSSIDKIKRELSYKPEWSFERGMSELIEWSKSEGAIDKFDSATDELKRKGLL